MNIATPKEVLEILENIDVQELIDRMQDYTTDRFYSKNEKYREGMEYLDFVLDIFEKAISDIRHWDKDKSSFEEFMFGSLRSDLDNFFRKKKNKQYSGEYSNEFDSAIIDIPDYCNIQEQSISETITDKMYFEEISDSLLKALKENNATELELEIFESWLMDVHKPSDIASFLGRDVKEINAGVKRLIRRKVKIQEKWLIINQK